MLSDEIERFIKEMIADQGRQVELKRNELAAQFGCAPSQINYVLDTRFTVGHGYIIESRRGGGGFIRVMRVVADDRASFLHDLYASLEGGVGQEDTGAIIRQLHERGMIDRCAAYLLFAATDLRGVELSEKDKKATRAHALRNIIRMLLRNLEEGK